MCLYSIGSTLTALACSPALCAKADTPTYGWCGSGTMLVTSETAWRDPGQLAQTAARDDRAALLELQVRHDAEQVGVAGPLAVAVGRALRRA